MNESTAQAIETLLAIEAEQQRPQVGFKRLTPDATIPTKAHPTDSGFDLCAYADVIIEPGATIVVATGIAVNLPAGYEAQIRPRSGVTSKTKLRVQLGTIDNSYKGAIGVIVDNTYQSLGWDDTMPNDLNGNPVDVCPEGVSDGTYFIRKNDRIAQLVITRLPDIEAIEVFDVEESERGAQGFGSSGV